MKIETTTTNQRGEEVMPGYAIVALPSKKNGYHLSIDACQEEHEKEVSIGNQVVLRGGS